LLFKVGTKTAVGYGIANDRNKTDLTLKAAIRVRNGIVSPEASQRQRGVFDINNTYAKHHIHKKVVYQNPLTKP